MFHRRQAWRTVEEVEDGAAVAEGTEVAEDPGEADRLLHRSNSRRFH